MKKKYLLLFLFLIVSCQNTPNKALDNNTKVSASPFFEFKVEDSNFINLETLWAPFKKDLAAFSFDKYEALKPLILNQDIPSLQQHIANGDLSYESLTTFYLYRINLLDRKNLKSLNSIISLNPNIIEQAKSKDQKRPDNLSIYSLYGMPILLKDNINAKHMVTTAGAVALLENWTDDAFVTNQLKSSGALILGKANLSEWAYFFCGDCPSGYSAVGGQTFNPFGRKILDTGGSSSGSAVAVAANFCAGALGSETSGSILSPASQNGSVGLKPTVGAVSRSGIVPISSTLDTAGPISKNIIDNLLLYNGIIGKDDMDFKSTDVLPISIAEIRQSSLVGKRFGAVKEFLKDSLYASAIKTLKRNGAEVIVVTPKEVQLPGFLRLLNLDMKVDLPIYFQRFGNKFLSHYGIQSIIDFNMQDSVRSAPYGQRLFKGVIADTATVEELASIKETLKVNGRYYFDSIMTTHNLDAFLSINNYHAGYAAVAEYPALTVPMGLGENAAPKGLTFIAKPFQEAALFSWGYCYEKAVKKHPKPKNYL